MRLLDYLSWRYWRIYFWPPPIHDDELRALFNAGRRGVAIRKE